MKRNKLGQTDLSVSELCLGTMTFSRHTDTKDAHRQMDIALAGGINFIDTAEMYPVNPIKVETIGDSERVLGKWFAEHGRRDEWILATKHSGEGSQARNGAPITAESIAKTLEQSLKRLQTDYVDLYQFHWPNRGSYMFRKNWTYDPSGSDWTRDSIAQDMADCLGALGREVERGTIRAFGMSNESAWGTAMWLEQAKATGGPRVASLQNEYSLLCRLADTDLAEIMVHEEVSLLPFSPLAQGLLTGKYQAGAIPKGARRETNPTLGGRMTPRVDAAVAGYAEVARAFGLDLTQMALAWSARKPFVASSIFGATTSAQLEHLLGAAELELGPELLEAIDIVHKAHPMPY